MEPHNEFGRVNFSAIFFGIFSETPLPGKFYGWKSLVGYSPWGRKESDMTLRHLFLSFYSSFWRRKLQPTPVFLPGGSHGWRGLVGCSLRGCKELDMTEQLTHTCICICAQLLREWQICVPWNIHFMTALLEQLPYCQ